MPRRVRSLAEISWGRISIGVGVGVEHTDHLLARGVGLTLDSQMLAGVDRVSLSRGSDVECRPNAGHGAGHLVAHEQATALLGVGHKAMGDHLVEVCRGELQICGQPARWRASRVDVPRPVRDRSSSRTVASRPMAKSKPTGLGRHSPGQDLS